MNDQPVKLSSQNVGSALHLILSALPREILVKIHNRDDEAIDNAVYMLSHMELSLTPKHGRDIPGTFQIKFNRAQVIALTDMIFAIILPLTPADNDEGLTA